MEKIDKLRETDVHRRHTYLKAVDSCLRWTTAISWNLAFTSKVTGWLQLRKLSKQVRGRLHMGSGRELNSKIVHRNQLGKDWESLKWRKRLTPIAGPTQQQEEGDEYSWIGHSVRTHTKISFPRDREGYNKFEYTVEELSTRRVHWWCVKGRIFIFWRVILKNRGNMP